MKKDFQPEQKPSSEPQPIVLPSATDSAKPNVICSQNKNELIFYSGIGHDCQVTRSLKIKVMELGLQ